MNCAKVRLSSKRQIAIPADIVRELGLKSGQDFIVRCDGVRIVLTPEPESYTRRFAGALHGVYGDAAEIRDYLRKERASWDE